VVRSLRLALMCAMLSLLALGCASFFTSTSDEGPGEEVARKSQAVAVVPSGFTASYINSIALYATKMALAADGRIFVSEQAGRIWIIKNGATLTTPFLSIPNVDASGEHGVYQLVFDPNFAANNYVYVFYTTLTGGSHNRVSRFTANGDVAAASSELVLFEFPTLQTANHLGGAMQFGTDGKLYITHGENSLGAPAQDMGTTFGKLLRINTDGSIPTDNPFYTTATGQNRAIWALGLRSPFSMAIRRSDNRIYYNDVGDSGWEEVNDVLKGANYGWPYREGTTGSDPVGVTTKLPTFAYAHAAGANPRGCAVTAGAFYSPVTASFPASYAGKYFFAEYCEGWVGLLDANGQNFSVFATGTTNIVDMHVSNQDGALYYLEHDGKVWKVTYNAAGSAPAIVGQPANATASVGMPTTFNVSATGSAPLAYQWQKNQQNIAGATAASYTLTSPQLADNGAKFRVIVTNSIGTATSNEATLTVTSNTAPTPTINTPTVGTTYTAGSTITFSGTATDAQDGTLPASAFKWRIDFYHDTHFHPAMPDLVGVRNGSYVTPNTGEHSANVWFRVFLTVTDAGGLVTEVSRDVQPVKSNLTLVSNPAGLNLTLDDQPVISPSTIQSVVGMQRTLGVVSPQTVNGQTYTFTSWSDGGQASHVIATPAANITYTANFSAAPATCDEVVILQNRDNRYVALAGNVLSWTGGSATLAGAERFIRNGSATSFTLKSKTNGNFVVNNAGTLQASGATGSIISDVACGTTPANMGALRIDLNANGNAADDANNYWKSNDSVGLTDACPAANAVAWEKFDVVVTQANVSCSGGGTGPVCGNGTTEAGEQCDDGNTANGDGCSSTCQTESTGTCDQVVILQNRENRYVKLNGTQLSWTLGSTDQAGAERFIRSGTTGAFTLRSVTTGNFVVNNAGTLQASGATGATLAEAACGTTPANMGALRIDLNGNGSATDDANNYWKSNDSVGLTDACPAANAIAWEKFDIIVTQANVSCGGTAPTCGDVALNRVSVSATSVEGGWTAAQAIDAQVTPSRWASAYAGLTDAQADAQSITVDLGQNRWVGRVVLNWEAASAKDYALELSTDNVSYWLAKSFTGGAAAARVDTLTALNTPHAARYVRVRGIDRATAWGYSLYDIGVFGDNNASCGP
jgi:cysteine-rich repeat protein